MKVLRIQHIAVASKDMQRDSMVWKALFGLEVTHTERFSNKGQPTHQVAMVPVGDTNIEFVEAIQPDHDINKFIQAKGEGLFHICLEVDDLDAAMAELKAKGITFYTEPQVGVHGSRFVFLQFQHTSNVFIEIAEMPKAAAKAG